MNQICNLHLLPNMNNSNLYFDIKGKLRYKNHIDERNLNYQQVYITLPYDKTNPLSIPLIGSWILIDNRISQVNFYDNIEEIISLPDYKGVIISTTNDKLKIPDEIKEQYWCGNNQLPNIPESFIKQLPEHYINNPLNVIVNTSKINVNNNDTVIPVLNKNDEIIVNYNQNEFNNKELKNWIKFGLKSFFSDNFPDNPNIYNLGLTNLNIDINDNHINTTITLFKPGLLIGKRGQTLESLITYLSKLTSKEVIINIQEPTFLNNEY